MPKARIWMPTLSAILFAVVFAYQCPNGACLRTGDGGTQSVLSKQISQPSSSDFQLFYHLGGNGPWIPKVSGTVQNGTQPPLDCTVDQVHLISRHAERYPTVRAGVRMLQLYHRLSHMNGTFTGPLTFIDMWDFFMPDVANRFESLVPVGPFAGTLEAFQTGVKLRTRYEDLRRQAVESGRTRLWATSSRRIEETARLFAAGFYGVQHDIGKSLQIIPENIEKGGNTLTPGRTCRNYRENTDSYGHDYGYGKLAEWQSTYLPAVASRLKQYAPDVTFTHAELYTMQEICGFETLAKGFSPWCHVFTDSEWESFAYARDLLHYYRSGPGNKYGATMGWLLLNATKDVLMQGPDIAGPLFFSFVHDGDIVPFLSALDLLPQHPPLPSDELLTDRIWRTSDVTPMGGRIILERLACPVEQKCWSNAPFYPDHVYCDPASDKHFIRINVNDGIVAMPDCQDGPGQSCPLARFEEHVNSRGKQVGDFRELCGLDEQAPDRITFLRQPRFEGAWI